jgi:2-oxoglutarate dehydrogenase E1 component
MADRELRTNDLPSELNSQSLRFVDRLFADFVADPGSVPSDWREYFAGVPSDTATSAPSPIVQSLETRSAIAARPARISQDGRAKTADRELASRQERVDQLIRNFRVRGHIMADIDPLDRPRPRPPELDPAHYGFTDADYGREFSTSTTQGPRLSTLREILTRLRNTYCRSIGVQFMHIDDQTVRKWLQDQMEATENRIQLTRRQQLRVLERLTDAAVFESFLQTKFTGAKSFSLEGAESLIPLLALAIERAGDDGVDEIVLGMGHRGRLNVLANVIGKGAKEIFREFQDLDSSGRTGPGDVKYHLGYSCDWMTDGGRKLHVSLCFNPSHLEYVNAVALGRMRAKQDRDGDFQRRRGLVILIHGDAAFAGEGVVQECLNLSEVAGYRVGGTLHVIVNNQIGFTTTPEDARSSVYCTDIAKLLQIPILHVNGEDPEAVAQSVRLALDYRREFQRDVVIDMYCYRLRGHNEGDEPSFTQPLLYRTIERQRTVRDGYLKRLQTLHEITREEADQIEARCRAKLEADYKIARGEDFQLSNPTPSGPWSSYFGGPATGTDEVDTGVGGERLGALLESQTHIPPGFHRHPKLERSAERRREMAAGRRPLDWSAAEALVFASLATEGHRVRMSGQDTARGTFSQRHAVLHDIENGQNYVPLIHLSRDQAPVEIFNSPLSEAGVLGFEYGYSLDCPEGLVAWEAQYGDFANAAQVVIDQFIASAEIKWQRLSGLVLLLPHGLEGQGPEHSSARLERFLELAAEDNMQIVCPSTPAQYFHCLRRQVLRRWRKPLVVMTPKSLLRRNECASNLDEFSTGRFRGVLADTQSAPSASVGHVLLCSGKLYYDLDERRREIKEMSPPIVRIEQLYPLPMNELQVALASLADGTRAIWVQEEPENMGAWRFLRAHWGENLFGRLPLERISRPASASPATGSKRAHEREQKQLIERALRGDESGPTIRGGRT